MKRYGTEEARPISGYVPCGCRDCFEIAIGEIGAFCHECEEAGCEPDSECCVERGGCPDCGGTVVEHNEDGSALLCVACGCQWEEG
jgi:hypothetical protein